MKIIGGRFSGRTIRMPKSDGTRPTPSRVREALASVVISRCGFEGAVVLELFAGSAGFSFEALSRGAHEAVAVDSNAQCLATIRETSEDLGVADRIIAFRCDLLGEPKSVAQRLERSMAHRPATLVFADAPYADVARVPNLIVELAHSRAVVPDALFAIEGPREFAPDFGSGFAITGNYRYGDTCIVIGHADFPENATWQDSI